MNSKFKVSRFVPALSLLLVVFIAGCERPPMDSVQQGFRGTGMVAVSNPRLAAELMAGVSVPDPIPAVPPSGTTASEVYENVQVLGALDVSEFNRFMTAITQWVSPDEGCNYCHAATGFASDDLYTKVVARRMIEMTRQINSDWTDHVGTTGVTCYTCHEGNNAPLNVWVQNPGPRRAGGFTADSAGQNTVAPEAALSSLPYDPFSPFLLGDTEIRVLASQPLPQGAPVPAIKQTEETYALMMHMSDSLGVNCTFCHNSRAFSNWQESSPARVTAWHGIRMARELNTSYVAPLSTTLPAARLGPMGDAPKVNCATCHQGLNKPLMGANMLQYHPALVGGD
ncbi:MAG: photosynthetic reaction center cytochrome PufC [Gammaproteobacteria bacterium]|nr:photosynthetic reaction center cytochrome c subunit [Pseudomonadales bacterium]MCP5347002.1 photosynthetic reaction center cytochrome c subunit [Pseudomonadales bacterium]